MLGEALLHLRSQAQPQKNRQVDQHGIIRGQVQDLLGKLGFSIGLVRGSTFAPQVPNSTPKNRQVEQTGKVGGQVQDLIGNLWFSIGFIRGGTFAHQVPNPIPKNKKVEQNRK